MSTSYNLDPDGEFLVREAATAGGLLPRGNQQYAHALAFRPMSELFTLDRDIMRFRLTPEGVRYAAERGWVAAA